MSSLDSTIRTRPDQTHGPLGSPTSPRNLSGRRHVHSISTCTDFVRGSDLVGSQTKSVGACGGIWHLQHRRSVTQPRCHDCRLSQLLPWLLHFVSSCHKSPFNFMLFKAASHRPVQIDKQHADYLYLCIFNKQMMDDVWIALLFRIFAINWFAAARCR